MKCIHIDEDGQILGWYDKDIHTSIPTPNIEVSDEVWQNAINNNHNKVNKYGITELYDFRSSEEIADQLKAERKVEIAHQLETLTITTSKGNTFDANNQARLDMQNAITSSDFLVVTQTKWRVADNSEVLIELIELKEALALAIQEYARVKGIGA